MYYYNPDKDVFERAQRYDGNGNPICIEYAEAEYAELYRCDEDQYVAQNPETKLPEKYRIGDEARRATLRKTRQRECFPIVNRGRLWYNRLTEAQKAELDAWYGAWLDVTETMTAPDKPEWLS